MQTRYFVFILLALVALSLVAFWQISTPAERPRVQIPGRPSMDEVGAAPAAPLPDDTAPLVNEPEILDAPPPAPAVTNDPSQGRVWLRVIDAATNRPLANTACRLMPARWQEWGDFEFDESPRPALERTDADGLLSLTVQVLADETEPDPAVQVVIETGAEETLRLHFPVPPGWYAVESSQELAEQLYALTQQPVTTPVDVRVQRLASVQITARDRYGMPIPDAWLRATLLLDDYEDREWLQLFCECDWELGEGWEAEAEDFRREVREDQVHCTLIGAPIEPPEVPWYAETAAAANQFGGISLRDLPCHDIGVVAWHPRYGTGQTRVRLQGGRNHVDVFFREELTCELRIRVLWSADVDYDRDLDIELRRTTPLGLAGYVEDGPDWFQRSWYHYDLNVPQAEAIITGVPPGWMHVSVDDTWSHQAGAGIELTPGESRLLTFYLGDGHLAVWTPVVRCGGTQLEQVSLMLLGGDEAYKEMFEIYHDPESGETDGLELSPGTYTVWLPTLAPFTFELQPGQQRKDEFELKVLSVNITIGHDLAKYLNEEGEGARLDILPTGAWEDAREHLYSLDVSMRAAHADYDLLKPGVVRTWMVPPGEYEWSLTGDGGQELWGRLTFTEQGPTSLHFGIDSLPGYAALDLTLIGFGQDDPPEVWLDDDSHRWLAVRPGDPASNGQYARDDNFDAQLFEDAYTECIKLSETRWVCFGPPGKACVRVWYENRERPYVVSLPARLTVNAQELTGHAMRELTLLSRPEDDEGPVIEGYYDDYLTELSAPGWFERAWGNEVCEVPQDGVRAAVRRTRETDAGDVRVEYAEVHFEAGREALQLKLWALDYRPAATLNLEFKGRGSPEQPLDAWWFYDEGPRAPMLFELDAARKGAPRMVRIDGLTEYMPGGRLEFAVRGLVLPPGSYRLVPWPGAPAKYVREFTLQAGQHTTVTVDTRS